MQNELGIVGLGKMGAALARQLLEKDWRVVGTNRSKEIVHTLADEAGMVPALSLAEVVENLATPRVVWLMLPSGSPIDEALEGTGDAAGLLGLLEPGDTIIDGGNSDYHQTQKRYMHAKEHGIAYLDAGVSGGPGGARNGACIMVGGDRDAFSRVENLFADVSVPNGYAFFEGSGAGHFVKMVHNGIEYGMMQAIAEGFDILKHTPDFSLDLEQAAAIYNHGSVIESRLIGWMQSGFREFGIDLEAVSGSAGTGGGSAGVSGPGPEAERTIRAAEAAGVPARVIDDSVHIRLESRDNPSYQGKIINTLRNQFGGHIVKQIEN